jgi:hypothetical protein
MLDVEDMRSIMMTMRVIHKRVLGFTSMTGSLPQKLQTKKNERKVKMKPNLGCKANTTRG